MDNIKEVLNLSESSWIAPAVFVGISMITLLTSWIVRSLLFPIMVRLAGLAPTEVMKIILHAVRTPVSVAVIVTGFYFAFTIPVSPSKELEDILTTVLYVSITILSVYATASLISNLFNWYMTTIANRTQSKLDDQLFPLFRRVAVVLVYGIGGLLILDQLNININPLIAGLGLGGLAVALAIQPTLSNLFAGTYVMTEGVISTGDFIELENGMSGYVMDVGWRSTRIRTFQNNLVVIPNSRFAETIITNYQLPAPSVNVMVNCGVSYDSDLYQVEIICNQVMTKVLENSPSANKEYGGYFGYDKFGDSNVDFWIFAQATDRAASFQLKNTLMQSLHAEFNKAGIVINYPVRTLQLPQEWKPMNIQSAPTQKDIS
jgi:small-conductance mechanosensitive channel